MQLYFHVNNLVFLLCACTPKLLYTYMFVHLYTNTNIRISFLCVLITLWYAPALVVSWNSSTSLHTSIWHRQVICCSIDGIFFFYIFSLGTSLLSFYFYGIHSKDQTIKSWLKGIYMSLCCVYYAHSKF